jgi:hypothetical protein
MSFWAQVKQTGEGRFHRHGGCSNELLTWHTETGGIAKANLNQFG